MPKIMLNGVDYSTPVTVNGGLSDLCWNYSIRFGGTIEEEWADTDISGDILKDGTYLVRSIVSIYKSGNEYIGSYAGIMNWINKDNINKNGEESLTEEIMLNFSGQTTDSLRFFLRTTSSNIDKGLTLQSAFNKTINSAINSVYADIKLLFLRFF
jgi:hypothetical protein